MITLKVWNSLSQRKRREIAKIVYEHMSPEFIEDISDPFHHNFDYEGGHWYKLMLSQCTLSKDKKSIKILTTIRIE